MKQIPRRVRQPDTTRQDSTGPAPELDHIAAVWGETAVHRTNHPIQGWLDSPIVLEAYVQPKIAGAPKINWLIGICRRLGVPSKTRWLSLGCGAAGQEIHAAQVGALASMLALDASTAALDEAQKAAATQNVNNIEFGTVDLDNMELPAESFDVVLMNMALHHVKRLPSTLTQVARTLRPDGYFIINEYIGPRQFQFTDLQLSITQSLLQALPERLRMDSSSGAVKHEYLRLPPAHWNVADPSEAIRSDEIVAEIERQFRVVERIDYGGTILNPLLEHIVHNFDPADEQDVATISLLGRFEEKLIHHGVLPSDFVVMVMGQK